MKNYKIDNPKLVKILEERGKVLTEARKKQTDVEAIQKEQAKLGYKMDRLKDKTTPIMDEELKNLKVEEFGYVARVFLKDGCAYVEIRNQVDDYIELLREKANDKCNNTKQEGKKAKDKSK